MNNLIQLSNLNKIFVNEKKVNVLKKINYKFRKGKIYSIMGPSGSGKSTLLNLLSLIDRPTSGSITIENNYIDFKDSKKNDLLRAKKIVADKTLDNAIIQGKYLYIPTSENLVKKNYIRIAAKKLERRNQY